MATSKKRGRGSSTPTSHNSQAPVDRGQATERSGIALLRIGLNGFRSTRQPDEYVAFCPCHDDEAGGKPSLAISVRPHRMNGLPTVLYACKCGAGLFQVAAAIGVKPHLIMEPGDDVPPPLKPKPPWPLPSPADVADWCDALWSRPSKVTYLRDQRGLTDRTVRRFRIGYDERRNRYTLPVYDDVRCPCGGFCCDGETSRKVVNVRCYRPDSRPKMINWHGHGRPPRLYPSVPRRGLLVVCEGEWDALLLRQHGFVACTGTHGMGTWDHERWDPLCRRRDVALVYDCGDGVARAHDLAPQLAPVVRSVRVVDLGLGDKEDVTDWFVTYGRSADELRRLIRNAAPAAGKEG